jgi:hypothetical protein
MTQASSTARQSSSSFLIDIALRTSVIVCASRTIVARARWERALSCLRYAKMVPSAEWMSA